MKGPETMKQVQANTLNGDVTPLVVEAGMLVKYAIARRVSCRAYRQDGRDQQLQKHHGGGGGEANTWVRLGAAC
jgi:hypothetical protein